MLLVLRLEGDIPEEVNTVFSDAGNLELISDNEDIVDKLFFESKMLAVVLESVVVDKTMMDDCKKIDRISEAASVITRDLFVKLMFLVAEFEADILVVNEMSIADCKTFDVAILNAGVETEGETLILRKGEVDIIGVDETTLIDCNDLEASDLPCESKLLVAKLIVVNV